MARKQDALQHRNKEISHINRTLHKNSITDELTGLQNRRYFKEASRMQWEMAVRNHLPLTLVMVDVDFFKLYNDTYGHVAGDECLKQIARAMQDTYTRSVDIVSRYGGEEFAILTTDSSFRESLAQAEILCAAVRAKKIEHEKSTVKPWVTLSCGLVHTIPSTDMKLEDLIVSADKALYEAKQAGRNRVVAHESSYSAQQVTDGVPPASSASGR